MFNSIQLFKNVFINRNVSICCCNKNVYSTKVKGGKKQHPQPKIDNSSSESDEEHLYNIYASVSEDHKLLPDEAYPDWLWDLDKPDMNYGELVQMFVYGKGISDSKMSDYNRFCRLHNRTLIKLNNIRLQKRRKLSLNSHLWDV